MRHRPGDIKRFSAKSALRGAQARVGRLKFGHVFGAPQGNFRKA